VSPEINEKSQDIGEIPGARKTVKHSDLTFIGERVRKLKEERSTAPKQGDEETRIHVNHKEGQVFLPKHVFGDDAHFIGLILEKLALDARYDLILYESKKYEYMEPTKEVKDFLTGVLIGTDDQINVNVKVRSDLVETGRAAAFAVRVRGYFRHEASLQLKALKKDNKFFGNDPKVDRMTKRLVDSMLFDNYIGQYMKNRDEAADCKKAICSMLELVQLTGISDEVRRAARIANLIALDKIFDRYRRKPLGETQPKKKGTLKAIVGKLPDKPNTSPLLTKEEMKEIHDILTPLWTNLDNIVKNYQSEVMRLGFDTIEDRVAKTFELRWKVLTAFSSVTTNRLREIKKFHDEKRITKRKVDTELLTKMLDRRKQPKQMWLGELSVIIDQIFSLTEKDLKDLSISEAAIKNMKDIREKYNRVRQSNRTADEEKEKSGSSPKRKSQKKVDLSSDKLKSASIKENKKNYRQIAMDRGATEKSFIKCWTREVDLTSVAMTIEEDPEQIAILIELIKVEFAKGTFLNANSTSSKLLNRYVHGSGEAIIYKDDLGLLGEKDQLIIEISTDVEL